MVTVIGRFARVALAAVALMAAAPLSAAAQGAGVGLKGGFLFSQIDVGGDNLGTEELLDNKEGWVAGIFFGGNRRGTVGIQGELLYGKKGAKIDQSDLDIHFIEIPVLLRVNGGSRSLAGLNVYGIVGPAFDVRLTSEVDGIDIDDDIEGFDVGLVVGAGVEVSRLIFEGRYTRGLRNISKDFSLSDEIKTRAWALLVGIRFN